MLGQGVLDGVADQVFGDILKNLPLEALQRPPWRALCRAGSRAGGPACCSRVDAADLGVDHVGGDFDDEILPRLVDVDEFVFIVWMLGVWLRSAVRSAASA